MGASLGLAGHDGGGGGHQGAAVVWACSRMHQAGLCVKRRINGPIPTGSFKMKHVYYIVYTYAFSVS